MQITQCTFSLLVSFITFFSPHIFQFTATPSVENVVTEAQYSGRAESIALSGKGNGVNASAARQKKSLPQRDA